VPVVREFYSLTVQRRYNNKVGLYDWSATLFDTAVTGWDCILGNAAADGWELVSVCVDGYNVGTISTEAAGSDSSSPDYATIPESLRFSAVDTALIPSAAGLSIQIYPQDLNRA
jgi:hypothetical protein